MARVGAKGQIVVDKQLRDELGIQPGWETVQYREGQRLVVEFIPPRHRRSVAGVLVAQLDPHGPPPSLEELSEAAEEGIAADAASDLVIGRDSQAVA